MNSKFLEGLNEEQKKAVLCTEGPLLLVAGAGAGKTKTITHRIMKIIENGVHPSNILAITFTNKAGKEMKDRIEGMLLENPELFIKSNKTFPTIKTFHSLGVLILKENADVLKIPRHFNILDKSDSKKIIKKALEELSYDPKEHLDKVSSIISSEKSLGVDIEEFVNKGFSDFSIDLTKKVWLMYEKTKKKEGSLDFDDLLLMTLKLFEKNRDILDRYQERFKYISVDEYQDTNKVQDKIVSLIAEKYENICVVGDSDQNIYSWRGADIKNMLLFEKKYPKCQVILLEQNYRSTKNIISASNQIIQKNNQRIDKNLFTLNDDGEKISIFEGFTEADEAHFIAQKTKDLIENGKKPNEIAVLYRANFQSRILEEAFLAYAVPYQMIGTKFFERKEVKDCISYIKASLNRENVADFTRVVNVPARGIGKTTILKIESGQEELLPFKTQEKILNFRKILEKIADFIKTNKVSDSIRYTIEISGLKKELEESKKEEDFERLQNIMELVSLGTYYDKNFGEDGMELFLTEVSLLTDEDDIKKEKDGVKLMTIHGSKGLEFDTVFISGLEEDLFPHQRFSKERDKKDEEEERRLCYVAITRAKKKLYLCHSQTRIIFGEKKINSPSRFIEEIDEGLKEYEKKNLISFNTGGYFKIDF